LQPAIVSVIHLSIAEDGKLIRILFKDGLTGGAAAATFR
jgi:hypothetical protein